jgi:membrane fusion protein, heavy metal efflux system
MKPKAAVSVLMLIVLTACGTDPSARQLVAPPQKTFARDGRVIFPGDSPQLAQIRVEEVKTASVPMDVVEAPGKIEVNPNRVSHVVLPVAGRVTAVAVRLGDAVVQSQPIIALESPDSDAAVSVLMQAEAAVAQARVALAKAQADADRLRDLLQHNAAAQKDVLNADSIVAQSKAALEQSEAAGKQAAGRLAILGLEPGKFGQVVRILAPVPGKVLEISIAAGEFRNDTAAPVMTIADLSTVWVSADVPESAIRLIDPGERVDIELTAYPGEVLHGRVMRIADTVDPQTRTVKVRAELDNSKGRLRPEMFARVRHTDSMPVLPVVPSSAVVQEQGKNVVYREESRGIFAAVPVRTGEPVKGMVPILEGLRPGDRIVTGGVMLLKRA